MRHTTDGNRKRLSVYPHCARLPSVLATTTGRRRTTRHQLGSSHDRSRHSSCATSVALSRSAAVATKPHWRLGAPPQRCRPHLIPAPVFALRSGPRGIHPHAKPDACERIASTQSSRCIPRRALRQYPRRRNSTRSMWVDCGAAYPYAGSAIPYRPAVPGRRGTAPTAPVGPPHA